MLFTVDSAKEFLLAKVRDQAARHGVPFDAIEQKMLLFSETSGVPDMEAQEHFDSTYDSAAYEAKVTKLLRRTYARDKRNADRKKQWKQALKALGGEDMYGLVMVDQANIPRVDTGEWAALVADLPMAITEFAILALYWFLVMRDSGPMGTAPDWVHILALIPFVALAWYVGKVFGKIRIAQPAQRPGRNASKN